MKFKNVITVALITMSATSAFATKCRHKGSMGLRADTRVTSATSSRANSSAQGGMSVSNGGTR